MAAEKDHSVAPPWWHVTDWPFVGVEHADRLAPERQGNGEGDPVRR
jgi:hypothetical protein